MKERASSCHYACEACSEVAYLKHCKGHIVQKVKPVRFSVFRSFIQCRWLPKFLHQNLEELATDPLPEKMKDSVVRPSRRVPGAGPCGAGAGLVASLLLGGAVAGGAPRATSAERGAGLGLNLAPGPCSRLPGVHLLEP